MLFSECSGGNLLPNIPKGATLGQVVTPNVGFRFRSFTPALSMRVSHSHQSSGPDAYRQWFVCGSLCDVFVSTGSLDLIWSEIKFL